MSTRGDLHYVKLNWLGRWPNNNLARTFRRLAQGGRPVRVYMRIPEKVPTILPEVEPIRGDLDNPGDLAPILGDVETVVLITGVHANELARGLSIVEAAKRANVRRIVFISLVQGPWSDSIPFYKSKLAIEAAIWASGIKWVVVRSAGFMQTDAGLKADILEAGLFTPPIGDVGVARIDTRDVGNDVAEAVLTDADGEFRAFGPEVLTGGQVANTYAKVLGMEVKYLGNDLDRWAKLKASAFPAWSLNALQNMYAYSQRVGMKPEPGELPCRLLPAKLRTMKSYAAELKASWAV